MAINKKNKVVLIDGGFVFETANEKPVTVRWANVQEVVTFKRDLFVYDCIYLVFKLADGNDVFVDEETQGWVGLKATASVILNLQPADWHYKVMFPAFETNMMKLFVRSTNKTRA